ncbi:MAG: hypothetical protein HYU80_04445 [Candidatus Blackburnbacteria bacterium]|nr:hypothetical protein [Candidatus Blackburnbacteria bacterium]
MQDFKDHLNDGIILEDNKIQFFTPAFYVVLEELIPLLKLKPDAYMYYEAPLAYASGIF